MIGSRGMILAAGKSTRMREVSKNLPKPLVKVSGISLLDRLIKHAEGAGLSDLVVNVHYHAGQVENHLAARESDCKLHVSDERDALLETGGGVKKALPMLGDQPFFVMNGDALWHDEGTSTLERFRSHWNNSKMDVLLLLVPTDKAIGYDGPGDFFAGGADCTDVRPIKFRGEAATASHMYGGVMLINPALYEGTPDGSFSNRLVFRKAAERGRLYGLEIKGHWMHVGTPEAIVDAERKLQEIGAL